MFPNGIRKRAAGGFRARFIGLRLTHSPLRDYNVLRQIRIRRSARLNRLSYLRPESTRC